MTSSLFATTMLASFLVVGLPHILPCPAPRITYADGEIVEDENGRRRRRRKVQQQSQEAQSGVVQFNITQADLVDHEGNRNKRECPVPKPGGKIGEILGFKQSSNPQTTNNSPQDPKV
jgi:cytochrome c oxidase assembly factor 2